MKTTLPMSYSKSIQTRLVLPPDTNHHQSIFGGKVLAYIDEIAAIAAMKHSQGEVVTASFDSVDFVSPAYAGDTKSTESMDAVTTSPCACFIAAIAATSSIYANTRPPKIE